MITTDSNFDLLKLGNGADRHLNLFVDTCLEFNLNCISNKAMHFSLDMKSATLIDQIFWNDGRNDIGNVAC